MSMPEGLVEVLPDRIETVLAESLSPGEAVHVKLKGTWKEGLICTDRRVMVAKGGFMTGQVLGTNIFQLPYANVASAEVKFHLVTGYFELSAGGMQNTDKSWWSQEKGRSPANAPNCISLSGRDQAKRFREACSFIVAMCANARSGASVPAAQDACAAIIKSLEELGRLVAAGIVTQQEFDAKKRELLSRL